MDAIDVLLGKAKAVCQDILSSGTEDNPDFNLRSLVAWEGCDTFGVRDGGPQLEVQVIHSKKTRQGVPVIYNYR